MEGAGCLCVPRPPALCQRSAMLFTHERGSEASTPAANYPVLIFFGEKETRAFQTWPNLISWGRRGRARVAFPPPASHEGRGWGARAAGSWPAPACLAVTWWPTGSVCLHWPRYRPCGSRVCWGQPHGGRRGRGWPGRARNPPMAPLGVGYLEWRGVVLSGFVHAHPCRLPTALPHCHRKLVWKAEPGEWE